MSLLQVLIFQMPWHKSSLSCQYFALNAILILDIAYTRRWNVTEIVKLSIKLKVSHNWELVYCRIYFTNIFSIFIIFSLYEKCFKTNYLQEIDIVILRTLSKNQDTAYTWNVLDSAYTFYFYYLCSLNEHPKKGLSLIFFIKFVYSFL
jgi:hypothetical protein